MNFLSSSTGKYFKKIYNTVFDDNNLIQQTCSPNIGYLEGLENITAFKDENKEISKLLISVSLDDGVIATPRLP